MPFRGLLFRYFVGVIGNWNELFYQMMTQITFDKLESTYKNILNVSDPLVFFLETIFKLQSQIQSPRPKVGCVKHAEVGPHKSSDTKI